MAPTEFRLDDHERRLQKVEELVSETAVLKNELQHIAAEFKDLKDEMKSVKLAMWGLAATLIAAAVTFALTVALGLVG